MKDFLFPLVWAVIALVGGSAIVVYLLPSPRTKLPEIETKLDIHDAVERDPLYQKIVALEAELATHKAETLRFAKTATENAQATLRLNQQQSEYIVDLKRECMLLRHKQALNPVSDPGYGSDPPVTEPDEFGRAAIKQIGYVEELDKWKKALDDCVEPVPEPEPSHRGCCGPVILYGRPRSGLFLHQQRVFGFNRFRRHRGFGLFP